MTELTKATATRCDECGKYRAHPDVKHIATTDGDVKRICTDCMDEKSDNRDGTTWKQLHKAQWSDAVAKLDEALDASPAWAWYQSLDSLTKSQALDRLAKAKPVWPDRRRPQHDSADRVAGLVKAEITRRRTAEIVAETKRNKRKLAKLRRKSDAMELAKGQAEQMLADLLATQAAATAQLDDIARRVDIVYTNAEKSYGAVTRQRNVQRTAELAREDQIRADWAYKASQTNDPILKQAYLDRSAGISDEN